MQTRLQEHTWSLRLNRHRNKYLQNAWNVYGEGRFVFEPLLYCDKDMTLYYEQVLLDGLKPEYNFAKDAKAPMLGVAFTDEHKANIGKANKGRAVSEETKQKLSAIFKGCSRVFTDEHKEHLREAWLTRDRTMSDEQKQKLSVARQARPPASEETRRKMSEAHKGELNHFFGKHHTEEANRKNGEAHKDNHNSLGRHHTEEAKLKMRGHKRTAEQREHMRQAQLRRFNGATE